MTPRFLASLAVCAVAFTACSDDGTTAPPAPAYEVPDTYAFDNVSYTGQQSRLAQLGELKAYMRTAATGETLDSVRLSAMYANAPGAEFSREYAKDLREKTVEFYRADFDGYLGRLATTSESEQSATAGTPGRLSSTDGEKTYLVDANGLEWAQAIEKGLMGATFYYQATSVYLGADKMAADNTVVEPGEGTAMQHHWDEAFGYLGVPTDFPASTDALVFWGDYANDRDADLGTNAALMDALVLGRAAIGNDDLATRDAAIADARAAWELVAVGTAIHYLNQALDHADDPALRLHALSEAVAFAWALQFNEASRTPRAEVEQLLTDLAGAPTFAAMDLWSVDDAGITAAREQLANNYGLSAEAAEL